jgi:hypothetical protein
VLTGPLLARGGLAWALRSLPTVFGASCLLLVAVPTLGMLGVVEGMRRATQYAIYRPGARAALHRGAAGRDLWRQGLHRYAGLPRRRRVHGVGGARAVRGGLGHHGLALAGLPIAAAWFALAGWLARTHRGLAEAASTPSPNSPQGQPA